jgi:hypothetical protein
MVSGGLKRGGLRVVTATWPHLVRVVLQTNGGKVTIPKLAFATDRTARFMSGLLLLQHRPDFISLIHCTVGTWFGSGVVPSGS